MKSLYIHFPFCETKCHYCDFYSIGRERTQTSDANLFEQALKKEAERQAPLLAPELDTVFFGGGTPSMTPPDSMKRALEPLWKHTKVTPQTEWTMEANPSSIELEKMRAYREFGVNRVSMGVQSMREDLLTKLGRVHSRDRALQALDAVFKAGFENASVDLLCGVPDQSTKDLETALEELTRFPITHLSCYLLTLPKTHRMYRELPDEETQLEHLLLIDSWMSAHGFEHYEISNFAKPGQQARHNLHYWKGSSYLGLGPSAHSYDARSQRRWKNVSSLHKYAQSPSVIDWEETLTADQRELEKWMLALRLAEGFPMAWLDTPERKAKLLILKEKNLVENHPSDPLKLRLTARGFAVSDQVIAAFA